MARLNIGLLSEQQQQQAPEVEIDQNNEALKTDQDMAQIQQADSEIEEVTQVIEETQEASQTMTNMADKIEQSETVSQDTVQVAQEAIGYFTKRTGLKMTKLNASMESYSKTTDKQAVVEQMRLAVESLDKGVEIAQEGVIERIKDTFSVMFTSYDKLAKELETVSKDFDEKGPKEETIKDPAFARVLNPEGKTELKSGEVVSFLDTAIKEFDDTTVVKSVRQMNAFLDEAKTITSDSKTFAFLGDQEAIDKFKVLLEKMDELVDGVEKEVTSVGSKNSADVEPLSTADKTKVVKKVEGILNTGTEYAKALKEYNKVSMYLLMGAGKVRFGGDFSKEGRIYMEIKAKTFKTYRKLAKLAKIRFEVAHACVKYIKASTK